MIVRAFDALYNLTMVAGVVLFVLLAMTMMTISSTHLRLADMLQKPTDEVLVVTVTINRPGVESCS